MSLTQKVIAANATDLSGYIGIPIAQINKSGHPKHLGPRKNKPYFFIPYLETVRHCRIYRNGFLDYTVRGTLFFETLEHWAEHCECNPKQICFGFDVHDQTYTCVNLDIHFNQVSDFDKLEKRLGEMQLGIQNVAVVINNRVHMAVDFIE